MSGLAAARLAGAWEAPRRVAGLARHVIRRATRAVLHTAFVRVLAVVLALAGGMLTPLLNDAYAAAAPTAPTGASASTNAGAPATPPAPTSTATARSAPAAAPAETPSGATSNATSGANSGKNPAAPTAGTSAPNAAAPTVTSSPAASQSPPPYTPPAQQLRFGSYAVFRNLIPSPALEAQAAEEFEQIVYGAQHADRLYPDTDARVIRVQSIVDKLIPYSLKWNERAKNWKWAIAVIRSPDIRMYCLPGGKIVIYSGILDRVHLNDSELAMLLGHEIAHALREHARERLGQQQAAQLDSSGTIPQLFGLADLGATVLGIGSQLLEMKYTPTDETEADVIGSDIASRAGYDPRAAITLWDKLAAATHSNRSDGYVYVHPYTPARRQDIMKRLPDMLQLYAKAIGKTVDQLPDYAGIGRPRRAPVRGD